MSIVGAAAWQSCWHPGLRFNCVIDLATLGTITGFNARSVNTRNATKRHTFECELNAAEDQNLAGMLGRHGSDEFTTQFIRAAQASARSRSPPNSCCQTRSRPPQKAGPW
jgi:hypothetical protein